MAKREYDWAYKASALTDQVRQQVPDAFLNTEELVEDLTAVGIGVVIFDEAAATEAGYDSLPGAAEDARVGRPKPLQVLLSKEAWIEKYGGQAKLDAEGFDVVPCERCDDTICQGWRVVPKPVYDEDLESEPLQFKDLVSEADAESEFCDSPGCRCNRIHTSVE
jgi:hypothetical protein